MSANFATPLHNLFEDAVEDTATKQAFDDPQVGRSDKPERIFNRCGFGGQYQEVVIRCDEKIERI